jgi:hypothetical protein
MGDPVPEPGPGEPETLQPDVVVVVEGAAAVSSGPPPRSWTQTALLQT